MPTGGAVGVRIVADAEAKADAEGNADTGTLLAAGGALVPFATGGGVGSRL